MSDITQKVTIMLGGDATQAKKVIAEVEQALAQSQRKMAQSQTQVGRNMGRDVGDQFGREFNRAQDKWLNLASQGFRRYGGFVGGIISDILEQWDSVDRAMNAKERLDRRFGNDGGGIAGSPIVTSQNSNVTKRTVVRSGRLSEMSAEQAGQIGSSGYNAINNRPSLRSSSAVSSNVVNTETASGGGFFKSLGMTVGIGAIIGVAVAGIEKFMEWRQKVQDFNHEFGLTTAQSIEFIRIGKVMNNEAGIVKYLTNLVDLLEKAKSGSEETIKSLNEIGIGSGFVSTGRANELIVKKLTETRSPAERERLALKAGMTMDQVDALFGKPDIGQRNASVNNATVSAVAGAMVPTGIDTGRDRGAEGPDFDQETRVLRARKQQALRNESDFRRETSEKINKLLEESVTDEEQKKDILKEDIKRMEGMQEVEKNAMTLEKRRLEIVKKKLEYDEIVRKLAEKEAEIQRKLVETMEKERIEAERTADARRERLGNRDRFGVDELANDEGANPRARRAAQQVVELEKNIKRANSAGRSDIADNLRQQANVIRNRLGTAGAIQNSDFGADFQVRQEMSRERQMEDYINNLPSRRLARQNGFRPFALPTPEPVRENDQRQQGTVDGYFRENGFIPTRLQSPE